MPRFRFSFDQEAACLNFFADFAAGTYCRNRLHETCSVAECPAHGLSGTCGCLFAKESGLLPDYGSAIGLKAVYRLLSFLEHPGGELLIQRLYRHLNLKDAAVVHSMKKAAEMFSFPCDFPEAEVEFDLKKPYELTRLIIRRGNRALETPEFIEISFSMDGKQFTLPIRTVPVWNADCTRIACNGKARYLRIKFLQKPGKSSCIDEVWILGRLIASTKSAIPTESPGSPVRIP